MLAYNLKAHVEIMSKRKLFFFSKQKLYAPFTAPKVKARKQSNIEFDSSDFKMKGGGKRSV
jgi:hypothetical protein